MTARSQYLKMKVRCIDFVSLVVRLTQSVTEKNIKFALESQLIRSAGSIGANFVEGNGASSKRDWLNFMNISRKSALETEYWLSIFQKSCSRYDKGIMNHCLNEVEELIKIFTRITKTGNDRYGKRNKQ